MSQNNPQMVEESTTPLYIKDLPTVAHMKLKMGAALCGMTMRDFTVEAVDAALTARGLLPTVEKAVKSILEKEQANG